LTFDQIVPFSSLQKTCISDDKLIKSLVSKGLNEAMMGLRDVSEGLFTSAEFCFRYEALNIWIPALATGLRRIVTHDVDPSYLPQISEDLGISDMYQSQTETQSPDNTLDGALTEKIAGKMQLTNKLSKL